MRFDVKINHDVMRKSSLLKTLKRWAGQRSILGYAYNRFQWHVYPRIFVAGAYPIHIDIELASRCNLKCPMCFREHRDIPKQDVMNFDLFRKIIDEIEGNVYSIKLTGRGEPLMLKEFSRFLGYLKGKRFGEVAMITNGQLLNDDRMLAMIDSGMDFVSFSIDGLKEQYETIRRPGKYEDIIATVTRLHALRQKQGSAKPMIRIQSVMLPEEQRQEFLSIWGPISDDILFLYFKDYSTEADNIQKENYPCPMPIQRMMVHFDGTVPMCINDEYEEAVMGNLNLSSVKDVWQGPEFRLARERHKQGMRTAHYANCAHCPLTRVSHGKQ
ncbi:MAG: radical SAM protein [Alphaproteobacteria bacterium]|nr:radical SAM protein [Alphaproteobacteria bacterium]